MTRIVTRVHHYKRPPKKKPPEPAIAQAVVTARRTDAKSKAALHPTEGKQSAIVTSVSRKEAQFPRHARGTAHDVEERDDHTNEATTARYRTLIARKPQPEDTATSKPQRKSTIVIKKQLIRCSGG